MAPRRTSSDRSSDDVSTLDLVFACAVCQRTVSEVYATDTHDHGLHSGDGQEEGAVTKMWIADCSHVFCGKHLEGGGIPFHPAGIEHAEVVCPVCVKVKDIRTKRRVFWVRGLSRGQYQDIIPPKWFMCPPEKLNSRNHLDDAIKFQYFSLDLYAKGATKNWRSAERKCHSLEKHNHQERKQWQKREAELKARIAELERKEVKLEKWEQRRKVINSALASFHAMEEDIESMRAQLNGLGFKIPRRSYAFDVGKPAEASGPHRGDHSKNLTEWDTAQSSATMTREEQRSSSSQKRKRPREDDHGYEEQRHPQERLHESQPMMPPPLPLEKIGERAYLAPTSGLSSHQRNHHSQPVRNSIQELSMGERSRLYSNAHAPLQSDRNMHLRNAPPPSSRAGDLSGSQRPDQAYGQATRGIRGDRKAYNRSQAADEIRLASRDLPFGLVQRVESGHGVAKEASMSSNQYQSAHHDQLSQQQGLIPPRNGLMSEPPRRRGRMEQYAPLNQDDYELPLPIQPKHYHSSKVQYFQPSHGTMAQQCGDQAHPEIHDLSCHRSSVASNSTHALNAPSQRRPFAAASASLASPYFKSHAASTQPAIRERTPTNDSDVPLCYVPDEPRVIANRRVLQQCPASSPPTYVVPNRHPQPQQPFSASQPHSTAASAHHMAHNARPPSSSQTLFMRSAVPSSVGASCHQMPSSSQRSRITLLPGTSRTLLNDTHDPQLSRIRGARQSHSHQIQAPISTPSRSWYSSGRRARPVYR